MHQTVRRDGGDGGGVGQRERPGQYGQVPEHGALAGGEHGMAGLRDRMQGAGVLVTLRQVKPVIQDFPHR